MNGASNDINRQICGVPIGLHPPALDVAHMPSYIILNQGYVLLSNDNPDDTIKTEGIGVNDENVLEVNSLNPLEVPTSYSPDYLRADSSPDFSIIHLTDDANNNEKVTQFSASTQILFLVK